MDEKDRRKIEGLLKRSARKYVYPPTPNLAGEWKGAGLQGRSFALRLAMGMALLLVVFASLMAVPDVRARLLEFLQIGAVRVLVPEEQAPTQATSSVPTATLRPVEKLSLYALEELSGRSTLEEARAMVDFELALPGYTGGLGDPDKVFVQQVDAGSQFVIVGWIEQGEAKLVLYIIGPDVFLTKGEPERLQTVEIDGRPGAFVAGPHLLIVQGFHQFGNLMSGPALIWEGEHGLTYRLEANLPLEEMIRIAGSIP